jgi:hypothetical protein
VSAPCWQALRPQPDQTGAEPYLANDFGVCRGLNLQALGTDGPKGLLSVSARMLNRLWEELREMVWLVMVISVLSAVGVGLAIALAAV